ncbi:MAG: hypothetical protein GY940_37110 [bacterium]|nr:hypothetical protein [bacterium]
MRIKNNIHRAAVIAVIIAVLVLSTTGCGKKSLNITFIPLQGTDFRIGPFDVPLTEASQLEILAFLQAEGDNREKRKKQIDPARFKELLAKGPGEIKGKTQKETDAKTGTAPFSPGDYIKLLNALSQQPLETSVMWIRESDPVSDKISPAFSPWFKKPFIFDVIDSREARRYAKLVFALRDTLSRQLSRADIWWVFTYRIDRETKKKIIVNVLVQRLPKFQ